MSMSPATPRDLIVAGLVSVVGQGVAVVAPHVGPALESAKAMVAGGAKDSPAALAAAEADPSLAWAKKCVAAWRESVEAAPEVLALGDWPLDNRLPAECDEPLKAGSELAARPAADRPSAAASEAAPAASATRQQRSMWEGQLDRATTAGSRPVQPSTGKGSGNDFTRLELALAPGELDSMRGGFETDNGLQFSFGIAQAVYINGQLVTTQTLNSLDVRGGGAVQIANAASAGQTLTIIQNGDASKNSVAIPSLPANGTVIQNNLNNQTIVTETKINASVNSLQALKGINLGDQLQQAIIGSTRR
jgi:hypothetical protein